MECSFVIEDDTEFWENMTQMRDASAVEANSSRSPASKRKKMTKDSTSPKTKFLTPYPKKK